MNVIIHSAALAVTLAIAYIHLSALNEGMVKNYFYITYFIVITYTIIAIGFLLSGRKDLAEMIGTYGT